MSSTYQKCIWIAPALASFTYMAVALHLFATAPNTTVKCTDDPAQISPYVYCKAMDSSKTYFTNLDEHYFAGLLFSMLSVICLLLAQFTRAPRLVFAAGRAFMPSKVSARTLISRFALSAWAYALIVSFLALVVFLIQAHGLASMIEGYLYEGGSVWSASTPSTTSSDIWIRQFGVEESTDRAFEPTVWYWMLGAYAHSPGFYCYEFFRLVAWWGNAGAAPPLLYACLFQECRVTRTVAMPLLSTMWFAYLIVRHVLYEVESAKSYMAYLPFEQVKVLHGFEEKLTPGGVNQKYAHYFYSELIITAAFCVVGIIGTIGGTMHHKSWRVSAWSGFVALILPWMCYAQPGVFNNLVFGGQFCPSAVNSAPGAMWFKATILESSYDVLVIRLFLVQGFGLMMSYGAKLLTQDHLPMGISFPIKSGWLRCVLPVYFLTFWGLAGRIMQGSFRDPMMAVFVEVLLVSQELIQVYAHMHHKGPIAYFLGRALGRSSPRVAAEAETPEYRTLADLPSRCFTYNFLICAHTVTEAISVCVAALIPLVYNYNVAGLEPVDRGVVVTNFLIAFVGETLVADGLFCLMAARQPRQAHTFLATWQVRPRGSIWVFVAATIVAFLSIWYAMLLTQVPKKDDSNLGYYAYPDTLWWVIKTAEWHNATESGDPDVADEAIYELPNNCYTHAGLSGWCNEEVWADGARWGGRPGVVSRCCFWALDMGIIEPLNSTVCAGHDSYLPGYFRGT